MGSETQRPFAIAIVSGLLASLPAVTILAPIVFSLLVTRERAAPRVVAAAGDAR